MCGIAGYVGDDNAISRLYTMLEKLEYRGYDSSGIGYICNGGIACLKQVGEVSCLSPLIMGKSSHCGIAHTRWATHGKPSEVNAHPHLSFDKKWAVVHNGIVENATYLKEKYLGDIVPVSETDTEIISHLLSIFCPDGDISSFISAISCLSGSYAICSVHENMQRLFLTKKHCPLFVAIGRCESAVSSDISCLADRFDRFYELLDGEYAVVESGRVTFYNSHGKIIHKDSQKMCKNTSVVDKCGYIHFMLKEIEEEEDVLERLYSIYDAERLRQELIDIDFDRIDRIMLVGCGTAYHACMYGATMLSWHTHITSTAHIASEFIYSRPDLDDRTLVIAVSQSGETADTISSIELARKKGCATLAITNCTSSPLSRLCHATLDIHCGKEIAVASTKAYNAMLQVMYFLSHYLSKTPYLPLCHEYFDKAIYDDVDKVSMLLKDKRELFILGRNLDYITAMESALKIKEIAYIFASPHPTGELKYGFIALIDSDSVCVVFAFDDALLPKTLLGIEEIMSRGGSVILITCLEIPRNIQDRLMCLISLPVIGTELSPIYSIIFWQKVSYRVSILRGNNPDKPRNLAKSVTVE